MEQPALLVQEFFPNVKSARLQQSVHNATQDSSSVQTLVKPVRLSQDARCVPHRLHARLVWQGTTRTLDPAPHVRLAVPVAHLQLPVEDALQGSTLFLAFVSAHQDSI